VLSTNHHRTYANGYDGVERAAHNLCCGNKKRAEGKWERFRRRDQGGVGRFTGDNQMAGEARLRIEHSRQRWKRRCSRQLGHAVGETIHDLYIVVKRRLVGSDDPAAGKVSIASFLLLVSIGARRVHADARRCPQLRGSEKQACECSLAPHSASSLKGGNRGMKAQKYERVELSDRSSIWISAHQFQQGRPWNEAFTNSSTKWKPKTSRPKTLTCRESTWYKRALASTPAKRASLSVMRMIYLRHMISALMIAKC